MRPIAFRNYMLVVLLIIQAYNYVDRQALGLVLQNIKMDLDLSDTQLGLLTGIPFAFFYAVMGIPIARWADRGDRVAIISASIAVWSALVALCGKATNFAQLMFLRAGVGVGEAGSFPPAQSLIPDYFSRAERPWANSIYMLNGPLSALVGLFVAGWLNELYGWRTMFLLLGIPGLALAPLAWLSLGEPRRTRSKSPDRERKSKLQPIAATSPLKQPSLLEGSRTLWAYPSFRYLFFYVAIQNFLDVGIMQFQPAYLIRSYGLETGELGTWYAAVFGIGAFVGIYTGGRLASRYAANDERLQLRVAAGMYCIYALNAALVYLTTNRYLAFALLAVGTVVANVFTGSLFATLQTLVPPRLRALSSTSIFLFTNLVGTGLGPLAVGALSDGLRPWLAEGSLRVALLATCPGYFLGAWYLWKTSQTITSDLNRAQEQVAGDECLEVG